MCCLFLPSRSCSLLRGQKHKQINAHQCVWCHNRGRHIGDWKHSQRHTREEEPFWVSYGVLLDVSNKEMEKQCPRYIQAHMNAGGPGTQGHIEPLSVMYQW